MVSEQTLTSPGKCSQTLLNIQGVPLYVDFYLLPLEGYDVVLGTQWLCTLGPIIWDFSKLQMRFTIEGKEVEFKGLSTPPNKVVDHFQIQAEAKKKKKGIIVQVYAVGENNTIKIPVSNEVQQLLDKYQEVINEPKGLPPSRDQDHRIPLQAGQGLVAAKPYRYPYFQKSEIEKLVSEMLAAGIIRPSNSSYSSPVILVKKSDGSWRMCVDYRALN